MEMWFANISKNSGLCNTETCIICKKRSVSNPSITAKSLIERLKVIGSLT